MASCRAWVPVMAGLILAGIAGAAALAQPVRLGTYICGGERQVVSRCGYSCQVDLPDRPLRNGLMQWDTVDPGPLAERLRACRHVDDPVNPPPAQNPRPATPTAPPPSPARAAAPPGAQARGSQPAEPCPGDWPGARRLTAGLKQTWTRKDEFEEQIAFDPGGMTVLGRPVTGVYVDSNPLGDSLLFVFATLDPQALPQLRQIYGAGRCEAGKTSCTIFARRPKGLVAATYEPVKPPNQPRPLPTLECLYNLS
jgi:hypothetical protein